MSNKIDEAFNWLILILSIISGVLIDLGESVEVKKFVALALIPPLLVLIVVWLFSHFVERDTPQVMLKSFAWFFSFFLFLTFIYEFTYITTPIITDLFFAPDIVKLVVMVLILVTFFVAPYVFYALEIQPIYRKMYEESTFLTSRLQSVGLYVFAIVTYLCIIFPFAGDLLKALL